MHPCAQASAAKEICALLCSAYGDSISAAMAAQNNITSDMNKHQRQGPGPADPTTLASDIGPQLPHITTEALGAHDSPAAAAPAPAAPRQGPTNLTTPVP